MSSSRAPLVPLLTAERSNGLRPTQDRIFTTGNAVAVLDGATHPDQAAHDGGWIADQIGRSIQELLRSNPDIDLADGLGEAIQQVATAHGLVPGSSPSTTVAIVRWTALTVDVLVLCDSPVVVVDRVRRLHVVEDNRLAKATVGLPRPQGFCADEPDTWRALVEGQERSRNTADGYWVAEANPEAARHAVRASWPIHDVSAVLAMTDGVSDGVERYGLFQGWPGAATLAVNDPQRLVDRIHGAEAADPDGERWRRYKRHDDKAIAVLRFDLATAPT